MGGDGKIIALTTGANKGIGFAIVRALCKKFKDNGVVYLAARNEILGLNAVQQLESEGLHPEYIHLDLEDAGSIERARHVIKERHGGLDILINNAGFAFKNSATEPFGVQAEKTVAINYTGTLNVCQAFIPILNPHARVVNVSSRAGNVNKITNTTIKDRITSNDLTLDELNKIMDNFVASAKKETHLNDGYPSTAYGMSKIGLTALTQILQKNVERSDQEDIVVNACCPGYVDTDMTSHRGVKTIDEGADTPVYLALLPPRDDSAKNSTIPVGQFVAERNVLDWKKGFSGMI